MEGKAKEADTMTRRTLTAWLSSGGLALALIAPSIANASPVRNEDRPSRTNMVDARDFNRGEREASVKRGNWDDRRDDRNEAIRPLRAVHGFSRARSHAVRHEDHDDRR
jgi:hypothetical protein